jgi:hypothetical protein
MASRKRVELVVTLHDGQMPALEGKVAKMPEDGDVLWKDGTNAYLVSGVRKTRKELFLTLEVVAAA